MITYDPSDPLVMRVPTHEVDAVLAAISAGQPFGGSEQVDGQLLTAVRTVLGDPRGSLTVEVSGTDHYLRHEFTLAIGGVLRRTRLSAKTEELGVSPTALVSGILLRLAGIAPVDPLSDEIRLAVSTDQLDQLFTPEHAALPARWAELAVIARQLPAPAHAELESAPGRAIRVVRRSASGRERTHLLLMLRGRYLVATSNGLGTSLHGTDPTGAARAVIAALAPVR